MQLAKPYKDTPAGTPLTLVGKDSGLAQVKIKGKQYLIPISYISTAPAQDEFIYNESSITVNSKSGEHYLITIDSTGQPVCTCKGFGYYNSCRHIKESRAVHRIHANVYTEPTKVQGAIIDVVTGKSKPKVQWPTHKVTVQCRCGYISHVVELRRSFSEEKAAIDQCIQECELCHKGEVKQVD